MVGTVVEALFRITVASDGAPLDGGEPSQNIFQFGLADAEDRHVARRRGEGQHVDVDVGRRLRQRIDRVGGIGFRAQQPLFLGRDVQEDHGAFRRRAVLEGAGHFDQAGRAGGVVPGAVEDVVPRLVLLPRLADVVPVGGVEDIFIGPGRAGDLGQQIVGVDDLGLFGDVHAEPGAQIDAAAQASRLGTRQGLGQDVAADGRSGRHIDRTGETGIARALDRHHRPVRAADGAAPTALDVLKADDADGAALQRLLGLVFARAVEVGIGAHGLRLAAQDDHDLAGQIGRAIVVPAPLGRHNAVAGEDQRGVGDLDHRIGRAGAQGDVCARRQVMADAVGAGPGRHGRPFGREPHQIDRLQPGAVAPARLKTHGLILGLQILQRQPLADQAGETPLQPIVGQIFDVVGQALGAELGRGGRGHGEGVSRRRNDRRRHGRRGAGGQEQGRSGDEGRTTQDHEGSQIRKSGRRSGLSGVRRR